MLLLVARGIAKQMASPISWWRRSHDYHLAAGRKKYILDKGDYTQISLKIAYCPVILTNPQTFSNRKVARVI
jgi:hypothetical protein